MGVLGISDPQSWQTVAPIPTEQYLLSAERCRSNTFSLLRTGSCRTHFLPKSPLHKVFQKSSLFFAGNEASSVNSEGEILADWISPITFFRFAESCLLPYHPLSRLGEEDISAHVVPWDPLRLAARFAATCPYIAGDRTAGEKVFGVPNPESMGAL